VDDLRTATYAQFRPA